MHGGIRVDDDKPGSGWARSLRPFRRPVIWSGGFRRAAGFERIQQQQDDAQGDGGVRDVEGGPVPLAVVHVQEVDDVAVQDAVDEIAQRPAQHQRPGDGLAVPAGIQLAQPEIGRASCRERV